MATVHRSSLEGQKGHPVRQNGEHRLLFAPCQSWSESPPEAARGADVQPPPHMGTSHAMAFRTAGTACNMGSSSIER